MKRVLVIADSSAVVHAVHRALRQIPALRTVGYANGRAPVGPVVAPLQPTVVVVDEMSDPERTVARIEETRSAAPRAKVILLASTPDDSWVGRAMRAGASAVISKAVQPVTLALLVREVAAGTVFHTLETAAPAARRTVGENELTARELEILRLVAEGHTNGRIARQLWVTEQTVKFHLSNVYRKLGVSNRTAASHYAHVHRLVDGPAAHLSEVVALAA